ncbi:MAG: RNA-binding cell elongation regulator Jag/EloR [Spirochaetota bacterium]
MTYEFEGKTETEAIEQAVAELGIEQNKFDVEVLDHQAGFLGINRKVRIRIHTHGDTAPTQPARNENPHQSSVPAPDFVRGNYNAEPENDFEHAIVDYLTTVTELMGAPCGVQIMYREPSKIGVRLDGADNGIIIGRKGQTLDALQTLVNIVGGRVGGDGIKIIVDSENYRGRREESLVRMAQKVANQVKETRSSMLLEPMNPFERRLIHTALNDITDIGTKSEGDGQYKQVRIFFRG